MEVKSSGLAIVLSFFVPGLGQLYAGRIGRGLGVMAMAGMLSGVSALGVVGWAGFGVAFLGLGLTDFGAAVAASVAWIGVGVTVLAFWVWNLFDAQRLCEVHNLALRSPRSEVAPDMSIVRWHDGQAYLVRQPGPADSSSLGRTFRRIAGTASVIIGGCLVLALLSFDVNDPMLFERSLPGHHGSGNIMGRVGATGAFALRWAVGNVAYATPTLFLAGGLALLVGVRVRALIRRLVALPVFVTACAGLFDRVTFGHVGILGGGGRLGRALGGWLESLFSYTGTYLLLGAVMLVSLAVIARISPSLVRAGITGARPPKPASSAIPPETP